MLNKYEPLTERQREMISVSPNSATWKRSVLAYQRQSSYRGLRPEEEAKYTWTKIMLLIGLTDYVEPKGVFSFKPSSLLSLPTEERREEFVLEATLKEFHNRILLLDFLKIPGLERRMRRMYNMSDRWQDKMWKQHQEELGEFFLPHDWGCWLGPDDVEQGRNAS